MTDYYDPYTNPPGSDTGYDVVVNGLCSEETEQALIQTNYINSLWSLPSIDPEQRVEPDISYVIRSMCKQEIAQSFRPHPHHPCADDCVNVLTRDGDKTKYFKSL